MTPRMLLTIIGATAIAFAIVIGSAAGSMPTGSSAGASKASTTAREQSVRRVAHATPGSRLTREPGGDAPRRLTVSGSDGAIAL
jgi:hypothetical protein